MSQLLYDRIDGIIENIDKHKVEPLFSAEKARRQAQSVAPFVDNDMVLKTLAVIVAYSQQAKSNLVRPLLESGVFDQVFHNYDVSRLREVNPCELLDENWSRIKAIRIKTKVFQLIMAARALDSIGPFAKALNNAGFPAQMQSAKDVADFWVAFGKLQKLMKEHDIPFLSSTTSLLHLLMHIGYDCVKPDVIVMRVALKLGIVDEVTKDANLRRAARTLQEYAVSRGLRPGVVDLYFLIQERQSDAQQYVVPGFQPFYPPPVSLAAA